jgi:hypothetical protein
MRSDEAVTRVDPATVGSAEYELSEGNLSGLPLLIRPIGDDTSTQWAFGIICGQSLPCVLGVTSRR